MKFEMKLNMLLFCALALVWIKFTGALVVDYMDGYRNRIDLKSTLWGSSSSGIIKSHRSSYLYNQIRTINVSAPFGYSLLVSIKLIDLRPLNQDVLQLYALNYPMNLRNYSNPFYSKDRKYYPREDLTYFAPNGQLGIRFITGPIPIFTAEYGGFELVYTVQASRYYCLSGEYRCKNAKCISDDLTCDGHNHCGDQSSENDCYISHFGTGGRVGLAGGILFICIAIGIGIYLTMRRSRSSTTDTIITTHPPPNANLTPYPPIYPQPGVYPPPPPPYSQGVVNPGYH